MNLNTTEWIYEKNSAQGVERGDMKYLGYEQKIRTLIRESIQNSIDARTKESRENGKPVKIKIKIYSLEKEERKNVLECLKWPYVRKHVRGAAEKDVNYSTVVSEIVRSPFFNILVIEDNNCHGLRGGEFADDESRKMNYRGFVKSENINVKDDDYKGAGGTYGVGKFIFWRYAKTSMVFANSTVDRINQNWAEDKIENPRLIGISRLPNHDYEKQNIDGNGFYGRTSWNRGTTESTKESALNNEQIMERHVTTCSVWGDKADNFAKQIGIGREGKETGTSIGIYGYSGDNGRITPGELERYEIPELINEIKYNWWRQIYDGVLEVKIELRKSIDDKKDSTVSKTIKIKSADTMVGPLVKMYEAYRKGDYIDLKTTENAPLDTLCVAKVGTDIATDPALTDLQAKNKRIEPHKRKKVDADLLVYVPSKIIIKDAFEDNALGYLEEFQSYQTKSKYPSKNRVALIRGKGVPVIKYDDKFGGKKTKDYFAILLAGSSRGELKKDDLFENFLKYCEDEGHTNWWGRNQLNKIYEKPSPSRTKFSESISQALDNMLIAKSRNNKSLRKSFANLFKFGSKGTPIPKPKFGMTPVEGNFNGDYWDVKAIATAPKNYEDAWAVSILPYYKSDSGNETPIRIKTADVDSEHVKFEINDGKLILNVVKKVEKVNINFKTDKVTNLDQGKLGRLGIRLRRLTK